MMQRDHSRVGERLEACLQLAVGVFGVSARGSLEALASVHGMCGARTHRGYLSPEPSDHRLS